MGDQARLRVAFVALNYAPSVGGAQEHVRRVAEGLAARGHDVEVHTTDALRSPSGGDAGRIEVLSERIGGVTVRRHRVLAPLRAVQRAVRAAWTRLPWRPDDPVLVPMPPILAGPYAPGLLAAVWSARRRGDVVVAFSAPFLTLVGPLRRRRGATGAITIGVPLLHVGAADEVRAPRASWRHRARAPRVHPAVARALRRADGVVASTEYERSVQVHLGVDPARTTVLPPGTDLDRFEPVGPTEARARLGLPERPTVGYVGRLAAYKGVDTLLEAAPALWRSHPDLTVLVAGSTTGWAGHRAAADRLTDERLVVREDVARDDITLLLSACDVVAVPSRDESFGMVIVEAWAAGRPVVAADIPVLRDVVRPGVDAEVIPPGDAAALSAALGSLLDDPERRAKMAASGHQRVVDDLQWPEIVAGWERFLVERRGAACRAGAA